MESSTAARWTTGLLAVLALLVVACFVLSARRRDRFSLDHTREVLSDLDGLRYRVHLLHGDSGAPADTMATLNGRAVELLRHLRQKYLRSEDGRRFPGRVAAVRRLLGLYNPDNLAENSPRDPDGDTSYTIDKGAILALCLREKSSGRGGGARPHAIHDLETLTFVAFHELTHIAVKETDHPKPFWVAFKFLLQEGVEAGLLRGVDYGRHPTQYCGMDIDYSPLYDAHLPALV